MLFSRLNVRNDFILLTAGTVFGSIIRFIYSVFSKKLVDPEEYGIFVAVSIIATYMNYLQLGTLNAYNRDYPQLIGKGDLIAAKKTKDATLTYLLLTYSILLVIAETVVLVLWKTKHVPLLQLIGYALIFFYSFLAVLNSYATSSCNMANKFNYTAIVYIIQTLGAVTIGLVSIKLFGYIALYVEGFFSCTLGCLLFYKYWLKDFRFNFDWTLISLLLISGIPLLINNLIWTVVGSIDKFVILGFLDTTNLAYYSIASMAFTTLVLVPQTMSNIFYIKVNREYGKTKDKVILIKSSQMYTLLSALCTGIVCLGVYQMIPVFVRYVMPNYSNGIKSAQIIIIGVSIYSSTLLYGNIFTILRENKLLLINSISLCCFNIFFSIVLLFLSGYSITNVALGTSISYALYSFLLVWRLKKIATLSIASFFYTSWLPVLIATVLCLSFKGLHFHEIIKTFLSIVICISLYIALYGKRLLHFSAGIHY